MTNFPYTYISCPCSDNQRPAWQRETHNLDPEASSDDDESTFDPRHRRSAFSLFPPEHLLYCEECQDIKCPRCVTEEIICWYCPSCLFETPSSMVKSEGNRCARNCFNCPICTSQLITASMGNVRDGPFILNCNYCMWTSLEIGIQFEKPTNLRGQLDRIANGGGVRQPLKASDMGDASRSSSLAKDPSSRADEHAAKDEAAPTAEIDDTARFKVLRTFYKDQITAVSSDNTGLPASALDLAYSSPSSLTRIMNLYSNLGNPNLKRSRSKPAVMREALTPAEGLLIPSLAPSSPPPAYADTTSTTQRKHQHPSYLGSPRSAHTTASLRPMPTLLRTKRSKRCATCKHILVKPEFKPTSTRYRIKLIALNYIPFAILKPLPVSGGLRPSADPDGGDVVLQPGKATQFVLTLKNPQFENMKVSLGCPALTPGKHAHKVTVLCPQFEIGKSGDVWDDALASGGNHPLNQSIMGSGARGGGGGEQIAGRLYDQGRNWASVVIEVLPATSLLGLERELDEDEDVIEVPIRVRLEWRVGEEEGEGGKGKKSSEKALEELGEVDDGRRELSYWMVLGFGRVATAAVAAAEEQQAQ
jgi:dynactin 4